MAGPFAPFEPHGGGGPRLREIPLRMIIPNMITIIAICAGLSGIRLAYDGRFETAVIMVLIAASLDAVDGRVARMLKASSKFGEQLDSLADIVNFGVAPGLVLYAYLLDKAHTFGWIAALVFAIACALRLARFNVALEDQNRPAWEGDYFVGVPAPAGGVLVMLPIYFGFLGFPVNDSVAIGASVYTIVIAMLMISRLPVYSGKVSGTRVRREFVMPLMLVFVALVFLLASYTWQTVAAAAIAYIIFLGFSARAYARRARLEAEKETAAGGDTLQSKAGNAASGADE
jgi:CDP-diacylglycerol--serine O-phosphatidyltransferase